MKAINTILNVIKMAEPVIKIIKAGVRALEVFTEELKKENLIKDENQQ